jgi:NitT/TauT family transport system substrate-binding protein
MKKILLAVTVLISILGLTACQNNEESLHLKIMAPIGTPALAQAYMESTLPSLGDNITYEIDSVFGTDPLVAAFGSGSHDIIYAPTNLGAKLISTGLEYQFAGTVVWGNLYIASSGYDTFDLDDLDGQEIIAFGQNATPDVILQAILSSHTFTTPPTITYVDSTASTQAELLTDHTKIVLMAEPALSVLGLASNLGNELDVIDLQQEWEVLTGSSSYPMAGIFVKNDIDKDALNAYLEAVLSSVNRTATSPEEVAQIAVELDYGFPEAVLIAAIPRSNLEFTSALDSRDALEEYFTYIMDLNPALIGGSLPGDEFYYSGE